MIAEPLIRMATSVVSPAGPAARLSTFIFHRVLAKADPLLPDEPDAQVFGRLLDWIERQFKVLAPLEACERLVAGALPERAAVITFDDGYRDNHDVALPQLQRRGMSACFFVATGFLDGGTMFNDRVIEAVRATRSDAIDAGELGLGSLPLSTIEARRQAIDQLLTAVKSLPLAERECAVLRIEDHCGGGAGDDLMMTSDHVRALHAAGMAIGGHTRSHPILCSVDDDVAREEIVGGAADIREITGQAPALFAYPNGRPGLDFYGHHCPMVRDAGFRFAFTTQDGVATSRTDPMRLPRFTPWDRTAIRFQARMLRNLFAPVSR